MSEKNNSDDLTQKSGFISTILQHKVASNLIMLVMILFGVVALIKLNIQFFPTFNLDYVTVSTVWQKANAEDVRRSITIPVERVLKNVDNLDEITSSTSTGSSVVIIKFKSGTNLIKAVDEVKQKISELRNLPKDSEKSQIKRVIAYEPIAKVLLISTNDNLQELISLARKYESELLEKGINRIEFSGLPKQEMALEVSSENLQAYSLTVKDIANNVKQMSTDLPSGSVGDTDSIRNLRAVEQARDSIEFSKLPVIQNKNIQVPLSRIGTATLRLVKNYHVIEVDGNPAIQIILQRSPTGDTLKSSTILHEWLDKTRPTLPKGIEIKVYDESWSLVKQRVMLLVNNGLGGLVLIMLILYIFLNSRIAFWVTVGIPVSFMATLMILYMSGGSINMISLFGLVMALGIIVDDAIVVGEDVMSYHEQGYSPSQAAEKGTYRMLTPVIASSITTIAAFFPLMLIGGPMGAILFAIPLVIIAVIFASLFESFFVLPGHLRHSLSKAKPKEIGKVRAYLDRKIDKFRNVYFRKIINWSLNNRAILIAVTFSMMIISIGLLSGGRIAFTFFLSPESSNINADIKFVSGTPVKTTDDFTNSVYRALRKTEQQLEPGVIKIAVVNFHKGKELKGSSHGSINVELAEPDSRKTRNVKFIKKWKENIKNVPGLESLIISASKNGPGGSDVSVQFTGNTSSKLKQASLELQQALQNIPGVFGIEDDLAYGIDQLIYKLRPEGKFMGFTYQNVGQQLSGLFSNELVQIYSSSFEEIEVRIGLTKKEQSSITSLNKIRLIAPDGTLVQLSSIVTWKTKRGFDLIRHSSGQLTLTVKADVDSSINNSNRIIESLKSTILPELADKYGLKYHFEGQAKRQKETFDDMKIGLVIGLSMIYIVLAWVFSSYIWPVIVMTAIPFGLIGSIMGHWWMGLDLTILSIFGFFGLSGIVINDSIILVLFYRELRRQGMGVLEALEEASVQRFRAVLLTSLTTIAGLTPLLFETSLQAQFLIPMATSIVFGLMFSTLLILLVIPVVLSLYEKSTQPNKLTIENLS